MVLGSFPSLLLTTIRIPVVLFFPTKVKKAHISRSSDSMIKEEGRKKYILDSKSEDLGFHSVQCSSTSLSFNLHFYSNRELGLPVVQWLRAHLIMQGTLVRSLVLEDSTCPGAAKPWCHNYWKPYALEPVLWNKRSYCNVQFVHCN